MNLEQAIETHPELKDFMDTPLSNHSGIAHTRWATHVRLDIRSPRPAVHCALGSYAGLSVRPAALFHRSTFLTAMFTRDFAQRVLAADHHGAADYYTS